jgi:hypothetical protein
MILIMALVVVAIIAILVLLGPQMNNCFGCNRPNNLLPTVLPSATGS